MDSQNEIENIYHTKFGNVEDSGTADGNYSTTTLGDSSKTWTVNEYAGYVIWIFDGTGSGQYREILSNTADIITVSDAFDTTPDATSQYRITTLGYKDQTINGSGTDILFTPYQPLINLISLDIDSVSITPSSVYLDSSGELQLSSSSESKFFTATYPQLIDLKYIYGVYPLPRIIKRLCICLAGMRTLAAQIAATYDDFTSISLPHLSGSKGEPYTNIREGLSKLQAEAKSIVGTDTDSKALESRGWASYRPFTLFG